ncbi:MAG: alpha-amylase family glycosyl hydrolase [Fusicatenibacter sp.]|nr:alpha-amylase family glycosyl hydrolase [Fusicatenibacter sp.]
MTPWYETAVFYHIYPIGLTGAPRRNETEETVHRFDILNEWLEHIAELGCTAIYIGPLFESDSHGYDTRDYRRVDRRLGDNEDFAAYVKRAHELGMRVVVDGVFNHTGREFFAFSDIRKRREQSPYCSWYKGIWFGGNTWYNDGFSYEAWHNCFELANLNLQNQQVRDYLLDVIDFWIDTFDIDGIRLDCADCLDFGFLEQMRVRTAAKKQDFWLMGEVIHGDYSRYIGDGSRLLHSVTNYELHKGLYSGHNDHNYFEIAHTIRREFDENGGIYRGMKLYSFVDNHDVDRLASKLKIRENLIPVYALLCFLPGIPSVYYGSEFGIEGRKEGGNDDPLRPALDLEALREHPAVPGLCEWIKTLLTVRRKHASAANGNYRELLLTNRQYAFARRNGDDAVIVAVNNDEGQSACLQIPAPMEGNWQDAVTGEKLRIENGRIVTELPPCGCCLIELENETEPDR